jgi:polysaccharide export outer membrane protein
MYSMCSSRVLSQFLGVMVVAMLLVACAGPPQKRTTASSPTPTTSDYLIGPGDSLQVFVWRNPEISVTVPVRPDGKISTPLVEDMVAVGKTPTQLGRDIEKILAKYIRTPIVTVIVTNFVGTFGAQIRVVGQAANPKALSYREKMTLLDVMIEVGGLAEFAAGNRASLVRRINGHQKVFKVRLEDLMKKGDITANVAMRPGDILIIPEARF